MSKINVFEIVGKNAISMQSGSALYKKIYPPLKNGDSVELNFEGVLLFASPFFNASIGLVLKDVSIDALKSQVSFLNLSDVGRNLLNHVISNAITYYKNSENISKGISETASTDHKK